MLEARNLKVCYGQVKALNDVSFNIRTGEIVAMIGPNGAGKSTSLKAVCGLLDDSNGRIESGQVLLDGNSILNKRTDQLVQDGISLLPEGRRVFQSMTVLENIKMGAYIRINKAEIKRDIERILDLFPQLKNRLKQKAGTLSSGEQQMLAITRALVNKPKFILADEPSLGLSPNFVELIFEKFTQISESGTAILLVEQNAYMALKVAQRAYVFSIGEIIQEDTCDKLKENEEVKNAFLGG
ncbi:MAG: ABC transporter ATP-binding protein [candidate division Zixibacteria bacterium]|nr:ABC transporter ATP-binding protein [candidate division Zixibacteria bacterium]